MEAQAQRHTGEHQGETGDRDEQRLGAGPRELVLLCCGGGRRRRGRRRGGGRRGARGRDLLRGGRVPRRGVAALPGERIVVLVVARALRGGRRGSECRRRPRRRPRCGEYQEQGRDQQGNGYRPARHPESVVQRATVACLVETTGVEPAAPDAALERPAAARGAAPRFAALRGGETARPAGLAAAAMVANAVAIAFTVIFTRVLGADRYGSLAALINLTVILLVPGSALQVAAAREGAVGRLGAGRQLSATLAHWRRQLLLGLVGVAVVAALARESLAALLNVEETWAAAAVPVAGALWMLLSLERGLLQAARAYRAVGVSVVFEALGRLFVGLGLVGALGVAGAYLGTPLSIAI